MIKENGATGGRRDGVEVMAGGDVTEITGEAVQTGSGPERLACPTITPSRRRPVPEVCAHSGATEVVRSTDLPSSASSKEGRGALADRLAEEMSLCWRQGERPTAEELLSRYEELNDDSDAVVKLICEEICLRRDYGQEKEADAVLDRHPQWRTQIQAQLEGYRRARQDCGGGGFPAAGELWTDYQLLAELGRGAYGRVFLAIEPRLANRPVVLKMSSEEGGEHLSLARLLHTHIVPLYAVQEDPVRKLRAICMPYFGGTSLAQLLQALKGKPAAARTGRDLIDALDHIQANYAVTVPARGPTRQVLASATYVQAFCWIGACLAEALQHAHERALVHLDVKPANVLLAADGQPMLLDFHLAQKPVPEGGLLPAWFGGTPKYMSPEQRLRTAGGSKKERGAPSAERRAPSAERGARSSARSTSPAVDGRSDIYSLGIVLYEALGGEVPIPVAGCKDTVPVLPPLHRQNPQVSVGLADIIHKCIAHEPKDRYADGASLAADLRRHLSDLPLRGVRNRSPLERWRKWRRRKPHALTLVSMLLVVLVATLGVVAYTMTHINQRRRDAEAALLEGQDQVRSRAYAEAVRSFERGLALAEGMSGSPELIEKLTNELYLGRRGQAAHNLHVLADHIRFLYADDSRSIAEYQKLEQHCQNVWNKRQLVGERIGAELDPAVEKQIRADLLDLAVLWADLRCRLAAGERAEEAYRGALQLLAQAEELLGASAILTREREAYVQKLNRGERANVAVQHAPEFAPQDAWEHFWLGRSLLGSGHVQEALPQFDRALFLNPQDFWSCFYRGQCTYRLRRYAEAVNAFGTCLALNPASAHCFYDRALAYTALQDTDKALFDYDRALRLEPNFGEAALNRGILHYKRQDFRRALADLERALEIGADPAVVYYNIALVHVARGDRASARASLQSALRQGGEQAEAQDLLNRLSRK
jgi:serine/threonine protein kinase/tetratricopeptide (TPR) repeat protein